MQSVKRLRKQIMQNYSTMMQTSGINALAVAILRVLNGARKTYVYLRFFFYSIQTFSTGHDRVYDTFCRLIS